MYDAKSYLVLNNWGKATGMLISGASSGPPRLQQGHAKTRILAEACREDASSRTRSNYHVVNFLYCLYDNIGHINLLRLRTNSVQSRAQAQTCAGPKIWLRASTTASRSRLSSPSIVNVSLKTILILSS